jgi:hypothetical protein
MNGVEKDKVENNFKRNVIIKVGFNPSLKKASTINDIGNPSCFYTEIRGNLSSKSDVTSFCNVGLAEGGKSVKLKLLIY